MDKIFSHSTVIAFFVALSIYISGGYALINLLKNFDTTPEKSIKIDLNLINISLKADSSPDAKLANQENLIPATNEIEPISEEIIKPEPIIEEPKPIIKEINPKIKEKPKKPKPKRQPKPKKEVKKKSIENIVTSHTNLESNLTTSASSTAQNLNTNLNAGGISGLNLGKPNKNDIAKKLTLIKSAIEKHKRYPEKARKLRQQGVSEIEFRLIKDGEVRDLKISKSSSRVSLDEAALKAVRDARSEFVRLDEDMNIKLSLKFILK
ncbi:energy transducer TonB [Campylobacter sp. RM16192]|uniref:energy transducer TonB n=1 Tax=Campylobacter sp. RM16192 TaxID=1660080 RepID=UPI0014527679|nr:energy transducer TonB [Campylobacter sp. RM16192]QCD53176.1 energy transduction protein TonB [Campylobacter sp. RM16192]